jgi:sarcosine oxidase subunit beta
MSASRRFGAEVVIVGGGIVGCAAAYFLAGRGKKVVLLEKSVIGGEASGRNAGGVRAQCRDRRERALAMASVELWGGLQTELGFETEYVQGGNIRLATNEQRMAQLRREADEERADGLQVELWDRDELRQRAPFLRDIFLGAKYCAIDGTANPILATRALGWAAKRAGAVILARTEALSVGTQGMQVSSVAGRDRAGDLVIETPCVIHAGGPWTPQLSRTLGIRVPIEPARMFVAITQRIPPLFNAFISSHDLDMCCRQAREGHVHIGGISMLGAGPTFDQRMPADAVVHLPRGASRMLPALQGINILHTWAGTLEMTPDHVPIIGPVEGVEGYILASGFSGHGFCLGPIVGKMLAEMILDGQPSISLDDFRLSRFDAVATPDRKWDAGQGNRGRPAEETAHEEGTHDPDRQRRMHGGTPDGRGAQDLSNH